MSTIDVLLPRPMVPVIVDGVSASFRAHNLWEAPDSEQWLAQHGASVRGIAASGRIDGALMAQLPNLEIVANFGVGYDGIDVEWAARHGVIVTNTPDVLTDEVADLAVGLLIATVRQLPQADRFLRAGSWLQSSFPLGPTLRTRTVGILGLGRIGRAIATRLEAFGLPIAYHGRTRQADVVYPYHDTLVGLAAAVDTLICVAPGGAATHHAVNAEVLAALGPSGVLINVGRGSVVDEAALIDALSRGVILSAGLDVFEDEPSVPEALIAMPHVVLLPHVGSASHHTRGLMGQLVVDNLLSWFSGKGPLSPVAETPWPANT